MENNSNSSFERYKLLIAARNFHYDNFNKWMTFFYIAVGALFVGYYSLVTHANGNNLKLEIVMLALLGYMASLAWYLSAKGYYYWYTNFVDLINKTEMKWDEEQRIYSVISKDNDNSNNTYFDPLKGANISTSKIAILLPFIITIAWGMLLIKSLGMPVDCCGVIIMIIISLVATFCISHIGKMLKSDISNHVEI